MDLILTKNNICDLDVFFAKKGMNNISRPYLSYLKIDSASRVIPAFHIGFEENMGFIDSYKINGGIMVFEVLEGYPLQDMLFTSNVNKTNKYKYRLEDLDIMDFYCVQKLNKDVYGDFILRNVKFISTKMDQGVETIGRKLIAEFVATEMLPFRIPYFYNFFISDNYDYHIIRNKTEIENIKKDIESVEGQLPETLVNLLNKTLTNNNISNSDFDFDNDNYTTSLITLLDNTYKEAIYDFVYKRKYTQQSAIMRIQRFIKEFYNYKNQLAENEARKNKNLGLFSYKDLVGYR